MDHPALFSKNVKLFIAMSIFALIGGYLYVMILSTGYRGVIFIHLSILFFASVAIFLRNIKTFLMFTMLVGLTFYYGFPGALRGVNFASIPGDQYFSAFGPDACGFCYGDLDGSGEVDSGDVSICLLDTGPCPGCQSDLDGSGEVDSGDVSLCLLSTGPCQ